MSDIVFMILTLGVIALDTVEYLLFALGVVFILEKDKIWRRFLLASLGVLLYMAFLYTWLPAKIGGEITYFDGEISLREGALYQNLGILLLLHAFSIVAAIVRNLWRALRRKAKLNGPYIGVETAFLAAYTLLGILFVKIDRIVELDCSTGAYVIALVLTGAVLFFIVKRLLTWGKKKTGGSGAEETSDPGPVNKAIPQTPPPAEAAEEFQRVTAERNRLTEAGDFASQIPLLTKATELPLGAADKTRLWNWLGIANKQIGAKQRSMDCFRTALQFDGSNPHVLNNMALLEADDRNYGTAIRYMDTLIPEAQKRGISLAAFYLSYARITGLAGDRATAQDYLSKAASSGCDADSIETIRRKIGLN